MSLRRLIGWLLCRLLLRRRLDSASAGRCRFSGRADRWLGRAGRGGGGRGRRGCGGRRRRRSRAGAFAPADQLAKPVDDQRDQDQNKQEPGDEQRGTAVPRGRLDSPVVRFGGFGLIGRSFGRCIRRRPVYAEGGLRGLLVVEVIRRAVTCHGNDGTDTTCRCCSERVDAHRQGHREVPPAPCSEGLAADQCRSRANSAVFSRDLGCSVAQYLHLCAASGISDKHSSHALVVGSYPNTVTPRRAWMCL